MDRQIDRQMDKWIQAGRYRQVQVDIGSFESIKIEIDNIQIDIAVGVKRQIEIEREGGIKRDRDRKKQMEIDRDRKKQMEIDRDREVDRQIGRQAVRQTGRQINQIGQISQIQQIDQTDEIRFV